MRIEIPDDFELSPLIVAIARCAAQQGHVMHGEFRGQETIFVLRPMQTALQHDLELQHQLQGLAERLDQRPAFTVVSPAPDHHPNVVSLTDRRRDASTAA